MLPVLLLAFLISTPNLQPPPVEQGSHVSCTKAPATIPRRSVRLFLACRSRANRLIADQKTPTEAETVIADTRRTNSVPSTTGMATKRRIVTTKGSKMVKLTQHPLQATDLKLGAHDTLSPRKTEENVIVATVPLISRHSSPSASVITAGDILMHVQLRTSPVAANVAMRRTLTTGRLHHHQTTSNNQHPQHNKPQDNSRRPPARPPESDPAMVAGERPSISTVSARTPLPPSQPPAMAQQKAMICKKNVSTKNKCYKKS